MTASPQDRGQMPAAERRLMYRDAARFGALTSLFLERGLELAGI